MGAMDGPKSRTERKLTPRELQFVKAYVTFGERLKAMAAAGYSPDPGSASRLLKRPCIRDAIDKVREEVLGEAKINLIQALESTKAMLTEARENKQFTAVATLNKQLLQLSGLGKLLSDHVEVEITDQVDICAAIEAARARAWSAPLDVEYREIISEPIESLTKNSDLKKAFE
jgi:phage terminase small subunit